MRPFLAAIGVLVALFVLTLFALWHNADIGSTGWAPLQVAYHEQPRCYDQYDCDGGGYDDGRGGDGGESGGHQGYGGGGGRSGDYDGGDGDGDRCRNICNNTFPLPGGDRGGEQR